MATSPWIPWSQPYPLTKTKQKHYKKQKQKASTSCEHWYKYPQLNFLVRQRIEAASMCAAKEESQNRKEKELFWWEMCQKLTKCATDAWK